MRWTVRRRMSSAVGLCSDPPVCQLADSHKHTHTHIHSHTFTHTHIHIHTHTSSHSHTNSLFSLFPLPLSSSSLGCCPLSPRCCLGDAAGGRAARLRALQPPLPDSGLAETRR